MFSMEIIDTDQFLDMPLSSQALYFHLGMRADDDGFVANPHRVVRGINANDDDLKLLVAKQYIHIFETGVIVIMDWKINNYLRSDRYKKSIRQEKQYLVNAPSGRYDVLGIPMVYQAVYPDKNRIDKINIISDGIPTGIPKNNIDDDGKQINPSEVISKALAGIGITGKTQIQIISKNPNLLPEELEALWKQISAKSKVKDKRAYLVQTLRNGYVPLPEPGQPKTHRRKYVRESGETIVVDEPERGAVL